MQHLHTDPHGLIRFAVISRTALGTDVARLDELGWFYDRCPALGVSQVFHAGGLNRVFVPDLPDVYPAVEGVATINVRYRDGVAEAYAPLMHAKGRQDWDTCPSVLPLTHGARSDPSVDVVFVFDPGASRTLQSIAAECSSPHPARIVLVGGHRSVEARYFDQGRSFVASVGSFHARRSLKRPPLPFGGLVVELQLHDDGSLDYCQTTFRDMSGGMEDVPRGKVTHAALSSGSSDRR